MRKLMLGNEAIARGAYEAGATVATAYPGTPSTEITENVARYEEIDTEWSVNEKVALEVGIGSSIAGARTLVSMKHVGLNVAADPLMSVSYPGVNAGLVIAVADDPSQHSSQNEQDTRYYGRFGKIPVLEPADSQECKDFVKKAFKLSEDFDTPVIVRINTRISHSRGLVELEDRIDFELKEYDQNPNKYIVAPAVAKKRRVVAEERLAKLKEFAEDSELNQVEYDKKDVGIITSGVAYHHSKEVFEDASFLKLGLSYPLPQKMIEDFVNQCETVYVIEELEPIFEEQIKSWGLEVIGKDVLPTIGELNPAIIREAVLGNTKEKLELEQEFPIRPAVLCPGCHHRGVFYILKKLKLHVSGDIGCYTLGAFPPLQAMDTCICMGASVGMAFGFEKARGKEFAKKSVAVIGDSTFWHTGVNGLIDLVYNQGNTTVIILDNSTTAMTGHQENPSTGYNVKGGKAPNISFEKLGKSIGIERVRTIDAYEIDEVERIVKEETATEEPSLIITKKPCVLHKRADVINDPLNIEGDLCTGCKKCLDIGCPAISFTGETVKINETLCVGCELCTEMCNFDAIKKGAN
ncbi:indolepyruvate ferredoxin oxidoreductase subunit alpha [Natroniella sulfidigena]|uniref:indolepyruvate ferredoxin oxidoreductase subunit alpha n=1 Tax=Natroniella sulfidigena TaxID=723921 RepID=UPI00200A62E9|nr:indolepyruvate ferredoxin oxidoreductase subunit alpha [Natroniella sulfidigena]MCK8817909.1 indolepyruvate ferredoxin oxidoreductase subunit alpha [Natroniella sulfidigena]